MNVQFKKGVLELCVLSLIARQDRYGYELVELISRNIEIAEGTIYPLLRRLTKDGLCTTYLVESMEGPPRKYYRLTPAGHEVQRQLLREWEQFVRGVQNVVKGEQAE
jgi:PadR family transcriptional regulator PadR